MTKRIVVGASTHAEIVAALMAVRPDLEFRGAHPSNIAAADLAWADTYIGFKRPPLPTMGAVRWVHSTGAGVDSWLTPASSGDALSPDIVLTRSSESFGPRIAEWVLARALAFTQQLFPLRDAQRAREWAPRELAPLRGARVLVVGTGDIGTHVAALFAALGCEVVGVSRSGGTPSGPFTRHEGVEALPSLVAMASVIVLTVPLTPATRRLFDRDLLSRCSGALLMNVGRGEVIEERALPEALDAGWLRGAALDVFETEPLPADSPLWGDDRVIIAPHISGLTTVDGVVRGFLECLGMFERGMTPRWVVERARGY